VNWLKNYFSRITSFKTAPERELKQFNYLKIYRVNTNGKAFYNCKTFILKRLNLFYGNILNKILKQADSDLEKLQN